MAFHTRNLSSSKKAQFFVLSAFAIVSVIYFVSRWTEPYTIIDTSAVALRDETFIFDNIKEKAIETVKTTKTCEDLNYYLEEFKKFVEDYAFRKNMRLNFDYSIVQPCIDNLLTTSFSIVLISSKARLESSFTVSK